jgi:hypothetical protein
MGKTEVVDFLTFFFRFLLAIKGIKAIKYLTYYFFLINCILEIKILTWVQYMGIIVKYLRYLNLICVFAFNIIF